MQRCKEYKQLLQICHKDNVFPEAHIDHFSLWEPINQEVPGYEQHQKAEDYLQQLYNQPIPGIDIPFLHDPETTTSTTSAPGDIGVPNVQAGHKSRVAKGPRIHPMQLWPNGPRGGLGIGPRGRRSPQPISTMGMAKTLYGVSRSGFIRNFLFSLSGPVLRI